MITPATRVVVGIDGSEASRLALVWAIEEAAIRDADLDVVHAWSLPPLAATPILTPYHVDAGTLQTIAKKLLTHEVGVCLGRTSKRPPRTQELVEEGPAARSLIETAKGAELLVVGSRGHGSFADLVLGSVSIHCLRHAPCPVAVIHDGTPTGPIVVGVDGSDGSDVALRWALGEAALLGAPLTVLSSWEWSERMYREPDVDFNDVRARELVEEEVARARAWVRAAADTEVAVHVVAESPGPALIEASAGARMLVVGTRGLGGFRGLALGSVSDHCAHHAHCPLVVVRPPVNGRREGGS